MRPGMAGRLASLALVAGAVALAASACSSPQASVAPPGGATPQVGTPVASAGTTALPTTSPAASEGHATAAPGGPTALPAASPSAAAGQATAAPGGRTPSGPFLPIPGPAIGLLTPEQGVGPLPRFEWTPVTGAARYLLFVFDTSGQMYWGWEGTATSVYLGGLDRPPTPGRMGPTLDAPMSWAVVAYDAGGHLVASSPRRPIVP